MMQRHEQDGVHWLNFSLFDSLPIQHGIFLRHGGVSQEPYHSLNLGYSSGDDPQSVKANRQKILSVFDLNQTSTLWQVHGNVVHEASDEQLKGDGLVTNQPHRGLLVLHADCQAAIFYDPVHHALANVHCGWRGSVANIYKETIDTMQLLYKTNPKDLLVGISPSLGPKAAEFRNFQSELPKEFWPFQIRPTYFDFWEISRWQLRQSGVLDKHIEIASICTYENETDFFSYRRLQKSGRHATVTALL